MDSLPEESDGLGSYGEDLRDVVEVREINCRPRPLCGQKNDSTSAKSYLLAFVARPSTFLALHSTTQRSPATTITALYYAQLPSIFECQSCHMMLSRSTTYALDTTFPVPLSY
jgi:hypothetical protein